jgi:hypothetical protein
MTLSGRDALLVGQNFHNVLALSDRLHRWEFRCFLPVICGLPPIY